MIVWDFVYDEIVTDCLTTWLRYLRNFQMNSQPNLFLLFQEIIPICGSFFHGWQCYGVSQENPTEVVRSLDRLERVGVLLSQQYLDEMKQE